MDDNVFRVKIFPLFQYICQFYLSDALILKCTTLVKLTYILEQRKYLFIVNYTSLAFGDCILNKYKFQLYTYFDILSLVIDML